MWELQWGRKRKIEDEHHLLFVLYFVSSITIAQVYSILYFLKYKNNPSQGRNQGGGLPVRGPPPPQPRNLKTIL
jgi:hypothetical protein